MEMQVSTCNHQFSAGTGLGASINNPDFFIFIMFSASPQVFFSRLSILHRFVSFATILKKSFSLNCFLIM